MSLIRLKPQSGINSESAPSFFNENHPHSSKATHANNRVAASTINRDSIKTTPLRSINECPNGKEPTIDTAALPAFTQPHIGTFSSASDSSTQHVFATHEAVIIQTSKPTKYSELFDRLAEIPTRSKQARQKLYVDLWSGQHWLGLTLTDNAKSGMLIQVSNDTAVSVSMSPNYESLHEANRA